MEPLIMQKFFFYLCLFSAYLLALVTGMTISWSSPVLPKLRTDNSENPLGEAIAEGDASWIAALMSLGAVFGPFPSAFSAEKFGRKWALFLISLPYIITFLILAFAKSIWLYMLARILVGVSVGGTFTVLPVYIAELCPDSIRGIFGGMMGTFVVTGVWLSYCIGPYTSIMWYNIVCAAVAACFAAMSLLYMPETPQYLISKHKEHEARELLLKLRKCGEKNSVDEEFQAICAFVRENSGGSTKDLFAGGNAKALIIALSMLAFQQLCGINIVLLYTQQIFNESGSAIPADISSIIIGAVQLPASMIAPALADKAGRRFLFILSAAGMMVTEIPFGVYFYLKDNNHNVDDLFWLPLACLIGFIAMYSCGMGALPWTVMAEIFPPSVKGIASSLCAALCWCISFILSYSYADVSHVIGVGGSFWCFACFDALAVVFVLTYLPETKGKSQKEIQQMLNKAKPEVAH